MSHPTLASLFAKYPWRTYAKFQPLAARYGFTDKKEIKAFLQQQAGHDKYKPQGSRQLPIYSKSSGAYQFDTLVQARRYKDGVEYDYSNRGSGSMIENSIFVRKMIRVLNL